MQDNTSSSSLRGMEIGLPPGQRLPPPSPATLATYEVKPLPPVPPRRSGSEDASFISEIGSAFRTPEESRAETPAIGLGIHAVVPDTTGQKPELPHQKFQSLVPRKSISKLFQIFGPGRSLPMGAVPPTPSGHNPRNKVKQLMGVDLAAKKEEIQEVSPISVESDASSVYSQDLEATISPNTETHEDSKGPREVSSPDVYHNATSPNEAVSPTWKPWRHPSVSPVPIPAHLNIIKTPTPSRPTSPTPSKNKLSPRPDRRYIRNGTIYRHDAYHAITLELARSSPSPPNPSQASSQISPRNTTTIPPPKRISTFSDRSYTSRVRIAPPVELARLDHLSSDIYKAPIRTPYPQEQPGTPHPQTGRWLSRAGSRAAVATLGVGRPRKQSLIERVFARKGSVVAEESRSGEGGGSVGTKKRIATRSGRGLKAPLRLYQRQVRGDVGFGRGVDDDFLHALNPLPNSPPPFKSSPGGKPSSRPLTPYFPRKKSPTRSRPMTPVSEASVPSGRHTPQSIGRMAIDRVHTPRPAPSPPLDRSSVGTTVSVWAARTNELLGLPMKSRAERRRDSLRGKIRVGGDGGQVGGGEGKRFTGELI